MPGEADEADEIWHQSGRIFYRKFECQEQIRTKLKNFL